MGGSVVMAALLIGAWMLFVRRGKRHAPVLLNLKHVFTQPHQHGRGDYCVRVASDLRNESDHLISIRKVVIESLKDSHELHPKEVCGDEAKSLHHRAHPPDLLMRLPLQVKQNDHLDYVFDVFFGSQLRRHWNGGRLRIRMEGEEGLVAQGEVALKPPRKKAQ